MDVCMLCKSALPREAGRFLCTNSGCCVKTGWLEISLSWNQRADSHHPGYVVGTWWPEGLVRNDSKADSHDRHDDSHKHQGLCEDWVAWGARHLTIPQRTLATDAPTAHTRRLPYKDCVCFNVPTYVCTYVAGWEIEAQAFDDMWVVRRGLRQLRASRPSEAFELEGRG